MAKTNELLKLATWNKFCSGGINSTAFKNTNPVPNAYQLNLLENTPRLNTDFLPLQLNPWNNLARHKVENAIVLAISLFPVDKPMWKAIIVNIAINKPSNAISIIKSFVKIDSLLSLGLSFSKSLLISPFLLQ